jgi:outer membrane biosynthesis protein TonB
LLKVATTWDTAARGGQSVGPTDRVETADQVEVAAAAVPGTPPPSYPSVMREAGIGATLTVQFIVDTTGRAGPPTIVAADVEGEAGEAFLAAIRASLARTRFRPAMIGGRAVRQLVQQQFEFVPLR